MKHDLLVAFKTLALALLLVVGVSYASAAFTPAPASPPSCTDPAIPGCNPPINVSSAFQQKLGSLDVRGILSGSIAYFTNSIRINTTTLSPGLRLDVEGRVGAIAYCDQNGANCVSPAAMGGGTNAGNLYRCPDAGAYNSGCVGQLQLGDANCDADKTIGGPGTIVACTLVGRLTVQ